MRVLIACEMSGRVREQFRLKGHDAYSCDILPSEIPGKHLQCDVMTILDQQWDMMIAHPPCTFLSYAGNRWLGTKERTQGIFEGLLFFDKLLNADIPKICIENPFGWTFKYIRKPDQIIEPYYFGDPYYKRTGLWLKGLQPLQHSANYSTDNLTHWVCTQGISGSSRKVQHWVSSHYKEGNVGAKRDSKERSYTFPGIAAAMADQWG